MKFWALILMVLLASVTVTAVVTRTTTETQPQQSLADKIDHACRPGYKTYDWNVYSDRLILVTCAKFRAGLLMDQYVAPVATA